MQEKMAAERPGAVPSRSAGRDQDHDEDRDPVVSLRRSARC